MALFAPEIVLYCALAQLREARKFVAELNNIWDARLASEERQALDERSSNTPASHGEEQSKGTENEHPTTTAQDDQEPHEISLVPPPDSNKLIRADHEQDISTPSTPGSDGNAAGIIKRKSHDLEKGAKGAVSTW